ncbi:MAG TPA: sigma-70 family RNA polymerase sigma factor [Alphaproteobacteria bacterium]|nr:sigma-70 family RNA polymerase sigma factor [Alphaproteobacteria bacterium]
MSEAVPAPLPREAIDRFLGEIRPKLHRYCARMTGSVIDGEDVVQETLVKAMAALPRVETVVHLERWLFRVAHNAALDFLRRRARQEARLADDDPAMLIDTQEAADRAQIAAASLHTFMRLPVAQRSAVILKDVLGYSMHEIGGFLETSLPAVKAALHRGRARLRELAQEPDDTPPPVLDGAEQALLAAYVERFNARDFDAVRDMLADEARLDLVNRHRLDGRREVGKYFANYGKIEDWHLAVGLVDGRPAVLVFDRDEPEGRPIYFVLLGWAGGKIALIRDFRYARYVTDGAEIRVLS